MAKTLDSRLEAAARLSAGIPRKRVSAEDHAVLERIYGMLSEEEWSEVDRLHAMFEHGNARSSEDETTRERILGILSSDDWADLDLLLARYEHLR